MREQQLKELPGSPVGWVYEACLQKDAGKNARRCPGPNVTSAAILRFPSGSAEIRLLSI